MTLASAAEVDGAGETGVVVGDERQSDKPKSRAYRSVTVADVDPDGPAAQKGIRAGDVILEVAGSCRPP